ncbi:hypothetical protein Tco_0862994 [Tanacetum coccineum]
MRPFGCPVTILNTIDHLGKFDGKADEGFFVSTWQRLHLLPLWNADPPFSQSSRCSTDAGFQTSGDDEKNVTKDPRKEQGTPMKTLMLLLKDEDGEEVDVHLYRSMIGSLMCLTSSRPDIMFAVCACARYQVNPKVSHLHAVKRIFRDCNEKKLIHMVKIHIDKNVADLLTKAFDLARMELELMLVMQSNAARHKLLLLGKLMPAWLNLTAAEELLMTTAWNEFSRTMASAIICLATNQKFNFSKYIFESMVKNLDNASKFLMYPRGNDTEVPQPSGPTTNVADEAIYEERDDSLERAATTVMVYVEKGQGPRTMRDTIAQTRRLKHKTAQAQEITSDLNGSHELEKKGGSKLRRSKYIYKGRKINDIDKDAEITLVHETQGKYGDEEMFDIDVLDGDEVLAELEVTIKDVNLIVDEVTLAQALAALKSAKVQEKANVVEEPSGSITTTPTLTTTTAATTITAASTRPKAKVSLPRVDTHVRIKRLLDDLGVTSAKLMLLVYKLLLLVFRVNAASTKLQLLKEFLLSENG